MSSNEKLKMLIHPVRLRIISQLVNGQQRSTADIARFLPEIAQATLYRHLSSLLKAGIIHVVAEKQVRGTIEKEFALMPDGESITETQLQSMNNDQLMAMFTSFVGQLIQDFAYYFNQAEIRPKEDGLSVRQVALWMNDEEFEMFVSSYRQLLADAISFEPRHDRRLRTFSNIIIPSSASMDQQNQKQGGSSDERSL